METDWQTVALDNYYAVKIGRKPEGEWRGEIIRLEANGELPATRLFDTPSLPDKQAVKEWASRALAAYREG